MRSTTSTSTSRRGRCPRTVSYTHLDVYKRQGWYGDAWEQRDRDRGQYGDGWEHHGDEEDRRRETGSQSGEESYDGWVKDEDGYWTRRK